MREIVFDTETTGIDPAAGDRIVEIGGIELLNHIPTGRNFHAYLNPERDMPAEAFAVHGLSGEFLAGKPVFAAVADEFYAFIGDAKLVAHNAMFDLGFVNAEFARTGHALVRPDRIIDTLALARRKHPGASNSLDALCARYGIDTARRVKHGALLDSELLAEVYIELIGGRQTSLGLAVARRPAREAGGGVSQAARAGRIVRSRLAPGEREAHAAFVETLGEKAIWRRYLDAGPRS
ncbi:DNA polymerase III subunit epsilon [Enterovirga sp.]|uniref:DNA polymerase III subunit epsilon n=1 Tax=Enterovirga sp. TaxID=2026350 RepID=UPI002BAAB95B|nr:DNA polymerase III subunit epsilon [Enterovirga sp.]HMO30440.1 DNA polymerase III subunit epsilon [Enterovirga sp.]